MKHVLVALGLLASLAAGAVSLAGESDPRAVEIAGNVMEKLGGEARWQATRFVHWKFFGGRVHYWDKHSGDIRIEIPERRNDEGQVESPELLVLMNVDTREGKVWTDGRAVDDADELREYLERGHKVWINDSYWMFMPYKLLDPGVTLAYAGEKPLEDGRPAVVIALTFGEDVGYTPQNRYEVFVARDTGLVEAWAFFADAGDEEPRFNMPWTGWKQFGGIWLATDHGRGSDWDIAVEDEMPRSLFVE